MSGEWIAYLAVGLVIAFLVEPEDGRTLGWVVAMVMMWPLSLLLNLMRLRL